LFSIERFAPSSSDKEEADEIISSRYMAVIASDKEKDRVLLRSGRDAFFSTRLSSNQRTLGITIFAKRVLCCFTGDFSGHLSPAASRDSADPLRADFINCT